MVVFGKEDIDYILSTQAIRDRAKDIFDLTEEGRGVFQINHDQMAPLAKTVAEVIKERYPHLNVPYHSRWKHFERPNYDRVGKLKEKIASLESKERVRVMFDLVIVSVLLDAGAGPDWKYKDPHTGDLVARSEGLGIASFDMFVDGLFSNNPDEPLRADADKLATLSIADLEKGFQISSSNPMVGLQGRHEVLQSLGKLLQKNDKLMGRPGGLFDIMTDGVEGKELEASKMLSVLLYELGPIWPSRITIHEVPLGDVWHHSALGQHQTPQSLVPFHKLSQWLCFSLLDPIEEDGYKAVRVDNLSALAEYRNGGLFIDGGVLIPRGADFYKTAHEVHSHAIIEWRALTVALIDIIAPMIRSELGVGEDFSVPKILEGGTWAAGRKLAFEKRDNGEAPINIVRDGTVF